MPIDNLQPGQSSESFPSIQEKNLQHLIKVLGTKQSTDALTELGDTDKETWKNIRESVVGIRDFVIAGGISQFKAEIKEIVNEQVQGALSPLYNELQPLINEAYKILEPIMPYLVEFVKWGVDVLIPTVQWIADTVQAIIDFLTVGGHGTSYQDLYDMLEDMGAHMQGEYPGSGGRPARPPGSGGGRRLDSPYIIW